MKKNLLVIVAVLFGMALNAQVSAWDGTAEEWTHGSGTPEDPYLIENAQNMAYLAQQVNAPDYYTNGYLDFFADKYFLLTTDLDLGGNNGLVWAPVGKRTVDSQTMTDFAGHFDGAGHIIYNMRIEAPEDNGLISFTNLSYGLFGNAIGGSIKNITMASDCAVAIKYGPVSSQYVGMNIGSVLGYGQDVVLDNCINESFVNADIEYAYRSVNCGGLFGDLIGGVVINCQNFGNVYCGGSSDFGSMSPAGIVSRAENCDVFGCSNSGDITCVKKEWGEQEQGESAGGIAGVVIGDCTFEQCYNTGTLFVNEVYTYNDAGASAGGIVGCSYTGVNSTNLLIKNCYSVANINVASANPNDKNNFGGGIFGATYGFWRGEIENNITIENSYATGTVFADTVGGILAHDGWILNPRLSEVVNSFYINTIESSNEYGESVSDDFMKSVGFVETLNADGVVFKMDDHNVNNGYPIFANKGIHSVKENIAANDVLVFPNPANNVLNISCVADTKCNYVEIFSLDGRLMKSNYNSFDAIDITSLSAGVYMMRFIMYDGTEITKRIVKE